MPKANQSSGEIGADNSGAKELQLRIAERIRGDSSNLAQLTTADSLGPLISGIKPGGSDGAEALLVEMAHEDSYKDIASVVTSTGAVCFFSETFITKNYAEILARARENNPCATIVTTVREESQTYPRPTNVELFKEQVFNIDPDELEGHLARIKERREFEDIKLLFASTGARYMYSNLHMTEDYARSLIEWEEVEQHENP